MEVPKSERKWLLVAAYELLGTALFVYCILTSMGNPLAAVVGLFSSIIVFGGITGGHFNPAVSIGVFLANGKYATQLLLLILIIIGQLLGAAVGFGLAVLSLYRTSGHEFIPVSHIPSLCPEDTELNKEGTMAKGCDGLDGNGFQYDVQAFYTQVVATFIFISVILMIKGLAGPAPTKDGAAGAMAVIATLYGLIFVALKAGPCLNPAVALAFTLMEIIFTNNPNGAYTHYIVTYTAGPAIGGLLAGLFALLNKKVHHSPLVVAPQVDVTDKSIN